MLRKIAEIKVPKGAGPREAKTNPIFATYDRQGAAFAFFFSDSDIAGAAANLLFMVDGKKVFVDDGVTLGETNETHTFTYPLPDKLLNYTGKVDGYLYFDFEDGSHSDEIHFVFTIKKSQIDETMEDAPDVYVKSFEEIKADVQSIADKATSDIKSRVDAVENAKNSTVGDIEKAKDDAESQIGDYVGEVERAKQDIDSSVSDVHSKASEASEDISGLVKSTEDARDEAVKSMNELDYSDRNLFVSSKVIFSKWYTREPKVEDNGRKISVEYKENSKGAVALGFHGWKPTEGNYTLSGRIEINGEPITQETFRYKRIHMNHPVAYNKRLEILSDGTIIATERFTESNNRFFFAPQFEGLSDGDTITFYDLQFQPGSVPTPWQPAMGDYDAKIKRLEKAITNLGGSI